MTRPFFSIITTTRNRGKYLARIYESLNLQGFKSFEWIVADDGSEDDTLNILLGLQRVSTFNLVIIRNPFHAGKVIMDNAAIERSKGEFVLWNDSDDLLETDALQKIYTIYCGIDGSEKLSYASITTLCKFSNWHVDEEEVPPDEKDTTWNDLRFVLKIQQDMLYCIRGDLIRQLRFPELDLVIPEGVLWHCYLGGYKTRFSPERLKMVSYCVDGESISFSKELKYCRGKRLAVLHLEKFFQGHGDRLREKTRRFTTFLRYTIHAEVGLALSIAEWPKGNLIVFYSLLPFALTAAVILSLFDIFNRRVIKTHRQFLKYKDLRSFLILEKPAS